MVNFIDGITTNPPKKDQVKFTSKPYTATLNNENYAGGLGSENITGSIWSGAKFSKTFQYKNFSVTPGLNTFCTYTNNAIFNNPNDPTSSLGLKIEPTTTVNYAIVPNKFNATVFAKENNDFNKGKLTSGYRLHTGVNGQITPTTKISASAIAVDNNFTDKTKAISGWYFRVDQKASNRLSFFTEASLYNKDFNYLGKIDKSTLGLGLYYRITK